MKHSSSATRKLILRKERIRALVLGDLRLVAGGEQTRASCEVPIAGFTDDFGPDIPPPPTNCVNDG